jgi:hypothetical protein
VITVMRDKYVRSWPQHEHGDRAFAMELGHALERDYSSDAHFAAYHSPNGRRLSCKAIDELGAIGLGVIVFDVDGPNHQATEEWRRELRVKVQALAVKHPAPYYYETRGGARIVYRQSEPTVLRAPADAKAWSREYAVACAYLQRAFAIEADSACSDWQRLDRLPHATRDGGRPENLPLLGDAGAIGTLVIDATAADVALAEARAKRTFRERARRAEPRVTLGHGLFFYLLHARGDVDGDAAPRGGWIVRCPNQAQHTVNTDWTTSTVLYPPDDGDLGYVECKHAHCRELTTKEWLRLFSDPEIDAARRAAGLPPRRARSAA